MSEHDPDCPCAARDTLTEALLLIARIGLKDGTAPMRQAAAEALAEVAQINGLDAVAGPGSGPVH
jgi:hypothetical protein